MRVYALVITAAALFAFPTSVFSQDIQVPGVEIGPGGVRIDGHHGREGASQQECEELRNACINKKELGEQGEGNCRINPAISMFKFMRRI